MGEVMQGKDPKKVIEEKGMNGNSHVNRAVRKQKMALRMLYLV